MKTEKTLNVLIPMAGAGIRFKQAGYELPKPLIPILGKPMIEKAMESLGFASANFIFVVRTYPDSFHNTLLAQALKRCSQKAQIISIDYLTQGPVSTCLLAREYIDNDSPLIIANCDQIMEWDDQAFLTHVIQKDCAGAVVTYASNTPKNSYARLDQQEQYVVEVAEKKVISHHSLNGIHYWREGRLFVQSADALIQKDLRVNGEFYISMTYNELIENGSKIIIYPIEKSNHHAVGVPEDFLRFERQNG